MTLSVMQVLHQGGGAGSVTSTLHLSAGLARLGVGVRFVCPPDSEVEGLARAAGLDVHPLQLMPRAHRANAQALAALLARHPVDLVNSQSSRDRGALSWLALTGRLDAPLVITRRQMPKTTWIENWAVSRLAARMIAVSEGVGDALRRRGTPARKLVVIPNGLVTERIDRAVSAEDVARWKERIGWEPGRRTIGIVARPKEQDIVLRALDRVETPVRLVLAGVDPSHPFARLAERVPARHAVVCLPFDPAIRPLYELLEIVLLPSRMEGTSQALLEAMALGKPVMASHDRNNSGLIRDGENGLLIPPTDEAAWAGALERLLREPETARRLAEAGKHTARVEFSLDRTVERTLAVYREVVGVRGEAY